MRKYELFTDIELDAIYRSVRLDETTFGATQVGEEILKDIEKEFNFKGRRSSVKGG
jgi:hypothetical protein